MNEQQKEYLKKWILANSYEGEKEPEWTPARVVNIYGLEDLINNILKIK